MPNLNSLRESIKFALNVFEIGYSVKDNTEKLIKIFEKNINYHLFLKIANELGYNLPQIFYHKMKIFNYFKLDIVLARDFLVFKNGLLQRPGVDFIVDRTTQSYSEGSKITFRKNLIEDDVVSIYNCEEVYWFIFKNGRLVDKSSDKPGYSDDRWL